MRTRFVGVVGAAAVGIFAVAGSLAEPTGLPVAVRAASCTTPSVTGVMPTYTDVNGGGTITIAGCGFSGATGVTFANQPAPIFTVDSDTSITALAAAYPVAPGQRDGNGFPADVVVTTPAGSSPITSADVIYYFWPGTPCSTAGLSASPPTSSTTGSTIVLTGTTFSCPHPQFRFWIKPPGGTWQIVQDYSYTDVVNTYTWTTPNTALVGTYGLEVDARDTGHLSVSYDRVANMTYSLVGCTAVAFNAPAPSSPSNPGTAVVLSASATCPGTPAYRFWVSPPGGGWMVVRDYDTSNSFSWNTADLEVGTYRLEVDVRDLGSSEPYEKFATSTYGIGVACTTPTLGAAPASPGATGGTVVFTAATGACANPTYRFWVWSAATGWTITQDFGPLATFRWTRPATGLPVLYRIEVDVRDIGSMAGYDAYMTMSYTLLGCTAATLVSSDAPGGQYPPGPTLRFTASSTCPPGATPTYRFWIRTPGGTWIVMQQYGIPSTFLWDTKGLAPGNYTIEVDVRDMGSSASYEVYRTIPFRICAVSGC